MQKKPELLKQLNDCIKEALTSYHHSSFSFIFNPEESKKTYSEMPVMYKKGQQTINGIIDRVIKTEETIFILDYKSHRFDNAGSKQAIAEQFSEQLDYYRQAIEKLWPQYKIKTGILFTWHNQIVWLNKPD